MAKWTAAPDPHSFPPPNRWATWTKDRSPQFKTHTSIGMAKNALSGRPLRGRNGSSRTSMLNGRKTYEYALEEGWLYEWNEDLEDWVVVVHVAEGSFKTDYEIWTKAQEGQRKGRPVSEKQVQKAIESILAVGS